jgi:hypothetical protein
MDAVPEGYYMNPESKLGDYGGFHQM